MARGARNARWPAIVFLLTRERRTVPELSELADAHYITVRYVVKLLEAEGLVKRHGVRKVPGVTGRAAALYEWQRPQ
jgi:predicted ArsR family transcriptional regulator